MPVIDNPGGGDCGFYAVAIGLLVEIQKQYTQTSTSPLFDVWVKQGLSGVNLKDLIDLDVQALDSQEALTLLNSLQMSLRAITAVEYRRIVEEAINTDKFNDEVFPNDPGGWVKSTVVYGQFMQLVEGALQGEELSINSHLAHDDWRRYNILLSSPEVVALAQNLANQLAPELLTLAYVGSDPSLLRQADRNIEEHRHKVVKAVFIQHQAQIISAMDKLKQKGYWANDEDLRVLAPVFKVNLVIPVPNKFPGAIEPDKPTLILVNRANGHWVTDVLESDLQLIEDKNKPAGHVEQGSQTNKPKPVQSVHSTANMAPPELPPAFPPEQPGHKELPKNSNNTTPGEGNQGVAKPTSELTKRVVDEAKLDRILDSTTKNFKQQHAYKADLRNFIKNLFFGNKEKISVADLDKAQAKGVESGKQTESDEDFAARLQEAEFRKMGL